MTFVFGHPNNHFAFLLDEAAFAKNLRLDAKTPYFANGRVYLFAGGNYDRNLINNARIAYRNLKSFADGERQQTE